EAVAAACTPERLEQTGLRQRLQHLAHRRGFESGAFRELGCAQDAFRLRGKHGEHHGGVVGEAGDAKHRCRGPVKRTEIVPYGAGRDATMWPFTVTRTRRRWRRAAARTSRPGR